jgi:hypothetical protein
VSSLDFRPIRDSIARMRSSACIVGTLVVSTCLLPQGEALAWNDFGHMEVAAVAYKKLKPASKKRAIELLKRNPSYAYWIVGASATNRDRVTFMRAATWPDAIKRDPKHDCKQADDNETLPTAAQNIGYTDKLCHKYWHYVNLPFSPDGTPVVAASTPNAVTQIAAFRTTLSSADSDDDLKSYDLTWLLHLVGDVHQPLHCVARFDKSEPQGDQGGNTVKITGASMPPICDDAEYCPYGPATELHAFYDVVTGESYCPAEVDTAVRALPAADVKKAANLDASDWVQEGADLAQSTVYVSPVGVGMGPFTVDTTYQNAALALGKQQIALAGLRLANFLEDCFAKEAAAKKEKPK